MNRRRFASLTAAPMAAIVILGMGGYANAGITDSDVAAGTARTAVSQALHGWALRIDQGDFSGAASLFAPNAQLSLYYNNTSTVPQQLTRTGRSPASTPTAGTEGGGCTANGRTSIANFLQGRGPTYGPTARTTFATTRTTISNTVVEFDAGRHTASARSYITPAAPGRDSNLAGLLWTQLQKDPKDGWQIVDMKIIFNVAQPAYPCQN